MTSQTIEARPEFSDSFLKGLYASYDDARRGDRIPTRADIDVFARPQALPYIYIVDAIRGDGTSRFRVRLMGTGLVAHLRRECTGQFVRDLPLNGWQLEWSEVLQRAMATRRPVVSAARLPLSDGLRLATEHVSLPLSKDGETVEQILGAVAFLGYAHEA